MPDTTTDYSAVAHFMRMDHWLLEDAALLLLGLDPRGTYFPKRHFEEGTGTLAFLDGRHPRTGLYSDDPELVEYRRRYQDILDLRENCTHPTDATERGKVRLPYFLRWAESKGITPPWQQWAIDHNLWLAESDETPLRHPAKDSTGKQYAHLLHLCIFVWESLYGSGKPPPRSHGAAVDQLLADSNIRLGKSELTHVKAVTNPTRNKAKDGNRPKNWVAPKIPDPA
ncbi:hypothetical protein [Microbulbifer sp. HZ11]|uniref:hypothetical protein n=1 Tax=Microbulbifer sp. HZ11 TaxID=1453501 RepID=UPI0005B8BBC4|nr:hypothetical protein [Microbulbifer sp. HZ11]